MYILLILLSYVMFQFSLSMVVVILVIVSAGVSSNIPFIKFAWYIN